MDDIMDIPNTWYTTNKKGYAVSYSHDGLIGILVFYDKKDYLNCIQEFSMLRDGFYNFKDKEYKNEILNSMYADVEKAIVMSPTYNGELELLSASLKIYIESMVMNRYWELADEYIECFRELSETIVLP